MTRGFKDPGPPRESRSPLWLLEGAAGTASSDRECLSVELFPWGAAESNEIRDLVVVEDGFVLVGDEQQGSSLSRVGTVLRYSDAFDVVWSASIGDGDSTTRLQAVTVAPNGTLYVGGSDWDSPVATTLFAEVHSDGSPGWMQSWETDSEDFAEITVDGDTILTASSDNEDIGWVRRLDASGNVLWAHSYEECVARSVHLDPNGDIVFAYTDNWFFGLGFNSVIRRYSAAGTQLAVGGYNAHTERARGRADGSVVVIDSAQHVRAFDLAANTLIWQTELIAPTGMPVSFTDLEISDTGLIVVLGLASEGPNADTADGFLWVVDPNGNVLQTKQFGAPGVRDEPVALGLGEDAVLIGGWRAEGGVANNRGWVTTVWVPGLWLGPISERAEGRGEPRRPCRWRGSRRGANDLRAS